jgi:sterol desaturase/sphingolipid hydroxylase (fatty acid hydroxylase superfamily)
MPIFSMGPPLDSTCFEFRFSAELRQLRWESRAYLSLAENFGVPGYRFCTMGEVEFQVIKSIGFVAALSLAVTVQRLSPHRTLNGSWRTNTGLWAINAAVLGVVCGGCACALSLWASGRGIGLLNQGGVSHWVAIPLSLIGLDLVSYFWHRANHRIRILWRFHQAHHSDSQYTVTTALRFHPFELLLALPVRLLAIAALGVPVFGVIVFEVVFAFANFWEHGNINLPLKVEEALGRVFITPALHRRHHSLESKQLNSNYGTIFSLWDRLLGSFGENRSSEMLETGLPGLGGALGTLRVLGLPARGVFRGR